MNIENELKREGIEVISQIDTLIVNSIVKDISRKIVETFPDFHLTESDIFCRLAKLNMYKAKMPNSITEANYFYKNSSIYFNENIDIHDLEEFAVHECIHCLQEIKDENNNLIKMGLCDYTKRRPEGLSLNEAAVQYISCYINGINPDFEKYYDINLYTTSPSYYPLECSLLNEILYFTGKDVLFKSTLFSNDDFKNKIISLTSEKTFYDIQSSLDKILKLENIISKIDSKINLLQDGSTSIDKLMIKSQKYKQKIAKLYLGTQNIIIQEFFNSEFNRITNLEELENLRRKLYKFSDIIGSNKDYEFFNNYYVEMMNKLEHKCNVLENGGIETAVINTSSNYFILLFRKLYNSIFKKQVHNDNI